MKKTIILSLAMLMGLSARCQDSVYESLFGSLYTQWYVAQYQFEDAATIEELVMTADTLQIDGSVYFCVKSPFSGFGLHNYHSGILMDSPEEDEHSLLIRESEDHSKLYFRPLAISYGHFTYESEEEVLIMDLDLEVGDTLDHTGLDHFVEYVREHHPYSETYGNMYPELRIIADSIYYQEGRKHIRTNLIITNFYGYPHDTLTFIEGIGPTQGLFYWTITFYRYCYERMLCCEKDDVKLYQRDGCNVRIITDKIDTVETNLYHIYPNPAHKTVEIHGLDCSLHTITLVSLSGQEVLKTTSYHNNVEINVSNLDAGLYLVHLDGQAIGKVIKQ